MVIPKIKRMSSQKTTQVHPEKNETKKSDLLLIVDDRERAVFHHLKTEASDINFSIKRIEIGDYAIVDTVLNKIIAVFERKTLEDLGSSIKDGRYGNKIKMINLRAKTGCALFYILEGPASPKPTDFFGGILYTNLESAIYHMMIRDNIMLINSLNTLDTVYKLVRFYKSMVNLANKPVVIDALPAITFSEQQQKLEEGQVSAHAKKPVEEKTSLEKTSLEISETPNYTTQLTAREAKSDKDILREMWSVFKGITVVSADIFITQWAIAEIIYRKVDLTKLPKGIKISKNVVRALSSIDKRTEERLLSAIPGISESTAKQLLTNRTLRQLLSYEVGAISIICVGKAQKKLGEVKAKNIKKYMFMFYDSSANSCVVKPIESPSLDSIKLAESREEAIGRLLNL